MFTWLAKLPISHFGILDPNYMRGAYTGVGRANQLFELLNQDKIIKVNLNQL